MTKALSLVRSFVIVDSGFAADTIEVTDSLWAEIDERYGDFAGRTLISSFSFDSDWPTWEVHPAGDEIVCLLAGDSELVLALPDGDQSVRLNEPGSYAIVPKNTWHTARVKSPTTMLFITPGEGTLNAEQPHRDGAKNV